jgi:hypothetical protein
MTYKVNCRMYDQELQKSVIGRTYRKLSDKMFAYIGQKVTTRTASPFAFDPESLESS